MNPMFESSTDCSPYLQIIHEALEVAQLNKDEQLMSVCLADAMLLQDLERLYLSTQHVQHPLDDA